MYNKEKKKLKNGFDALTPDLFDKICEQEAPVVTSQEALFGEFEDSNQKAHSHWVFTAAFGSVCAAAVCVIVIFYFIVGGSSIMENQIIIDVNPSIQIFLDEDNKVTSVEASNEDAQKIVSRIEKTDSIRILLPSVIQELQSENYLTKDSSEMLITYVYSEEKQIPRKQITEVISQYARENKLALTVIQQHVKPDPDLIREAEEAGVSLGKYYLIDNMDEKESVDREKYYDKNISEIISEAKENDNIPETSQDVIRYEYSEENKDTEKIEETPSSEDNLKRGNEEKEKDKRNPNKKQEKETSSKTKSDATNKKVFSEKKEKKHTKVVQDLKEKKDKKEKIKKAKESSKEKTNQKASKDKLNKKKTKTNNKNDFKPKKEKVPAKTKEPKDFLAKDHGNQGKDDDLTEQPSPAKGNKSQEEE